MPKEDAKHFPISEIKRQDYDDLVEMLQKEDTDHIDLKDCLQNLDQIEIAKAFLAKKKKSDTHTFLSLFNGTLVALAEFIPMNDPSKIDAIEILTYHPEEAENFIRAYLDLHKNDPTNAYVYLLPFAPKKCF